MLRMIPFSLMVTIIGFPLFSFLIFPLPCCVALHWLWLHVAPWCIHHDDVTWLGMLPRSIPSFASWLLHPLVRCFHDFLLKVPMMHSAAPTTMSAAPPPATSIPFVATAPGNQVWPFISRLDLANYSLLIRHSVCFGGWWERLVFLKPFLEFFFCIFWTDVPALLLILRWISSIGSFNWLQVLLLIDYIYSCCYYTNPQILILIFFKCFLIGWEQNLLYYHF